jgi:protein FAM32A
MRLLENTSCDLRIILTLTQEQRSSSKELLVANGMAGDEYAATGGSLKLKGVKDSKIDKKRKKKKVKAQPENETAGDKAATAEATTEGEEHLVKSREESLGTRRDGEASAPLIIGKTEAERRHEEMKRKRVCKGHATLLVLTHQDG